jgi:hypothetical protein
MVMYIYTHYVGKSTFGMSVALSQGILKCISTDSAREVMRSYDDNPILHRSSYEGEGDPVADWKDSCAVLGTSIDALVADALKRGDLYIYIYVYIYIYMYIFMYTCIYIFVCNSYVIHMYEYAYTFTYIYIHIGVSLVLEGVHIIPSNVLIHKWRASGGVALGVFTWWWWCFVNRLQHTG